jgi:hypothetical protein
VRINLVYKGLFDRLFERNSVSTSVVCRGFNFVMYFRIVFTNSYSRLQNFIKLFHKSLLRPTISAGDSFFFVNFRDFLAKASELQECSVHKYVFLLN